MAIKLFLIFGLSFISLITAYEIPEDCMVRNEIQEHDLMFDTLDFLMHDDGVKETNTEILLQCDSNDYDVLTLGRSQINLQRFVSQKSLDNKTFPGPKNGDWKRFQIGLLENLTLQDEDQKSWLPDDLTLGCPIKSVRIKHGKFTRKCPRATPTWKVTEGKAMLIPLLKNAPRQRLTLISMKPYLPIFSVDNSEGQFELSPRTANGTTVDLLPAGHRNITVEIQTESGLHSLKVYHGNGNIIHTSSQKESSPRLIFKGRNNDNFLVVQHLGPTYQTHGFDKPTPDCAGNLMWYIPVGLVGGIILTGLLASVYHNWQLHQRVVKMKSTKPSMHPEKSSMSFNTMSPNSTRFATRQLHQRQISTSTFTLDSQHRDPVYPTSRQYQTSGLRQELLPPVPPPFKPQLPHEDQHGSGSLEEIYCEMHPIPGIRPPNSFDLREECGCVETINDIYESAEGVF